MEEMQITPVKVFIVIIVLGSLLITSVVTSLQIFVNPRIGKSDTLELWYNGELVSRIYGEIVQFDEQHSISVMVNNTSLSDLSFYFERGRYPSNLPVHVKYTESMPFLVKAGTSLNFGIVYWVDDCELNVTSTDVWFDFKVTG